MLMHHLGRRASEWHLSSQHLPKRHAKRVQVRADVHADSSKLLGTGKLWCPGKAPRCRNRGLRTWFIDGLGKAEVDYFRRHRASVLQAHHDVAWFDVPMNEFLLVHCSQTGG